MRRIALIITCTALCALLLWLGVRVGLTTARAEVSPAVAATSPASASTTVPSTQAYARNGGSAPVQPTGTSGRALPMPREYMVLMTRSMFVRGHMAEAGHAGARNSSLNSAPSTASLQRAETNLVFNGVTQTASSIDALVEDTGSGHVLTVHSGDAVARGTVGKITMDALEYVSGGKVTTVRIGQNFTGAQGDVTASPTTTAPAGSGASPEDILERLRQKRLQELGGK